MASRIPLLLWSLSRTLHGCKCDSDLMAVGSQPPLKAAPAFTSTWDATLGPHLHLGSRLQQGSGEQVLPPTQGGVHSDAGGIRQQAWRFSDHPGRYRMDSLMGCYTVLQRRGMATSRSGSSRLGSRTRYQLLFDDTSSGSNRQNTRGVESGDEEGADGEEPDRRVAQTAWKPVVATNAEAFAGGHPGDESAGGMGSALYVMTVGEGEDDNGYNDVESISAEICSLSTLIEVEALLLRCGGATQMWGCYSSVGRHSLIPPENLLFRCG